MTTLQDIIGDKLYEWRDNPVKFLEETIQVEPDTWQHIFLELINKYPRVCCRSGHGTGKSASISWIIIWFLYTRYPAKITVTAPKADQLQDVIWAEVSLWRRKLPDLLRDNLVIQADSIYVAGLQKENFAVARTARRETPEGLQGHHSPNQLSIADEASGVPDLIFDVIEGTMTTPGSKLVMIGNPTRLKGYFYDAFHKDKKRWKRLHISSEKAKQVDSAWVEYMKNKYGENSNTYKIRVKGDFPTEDEGAVIPHYLAEEARYREVIDKSTYEVVWGVDVARYGDDRSALAKRKGDRQVEPVKWWRNLSISATADAIVEEYQRTKYEEPKLLPTIINIDVIGLGAGVYDILNDRRLPVSPVNVSEASSSKPQFMRKRDELWFACRAWFETQRVSICFDDEELVDELTLPRFDILPGGQKKVESKKDLKIRGEQSPDLADAWINTYASGYHTLYNEVIVPTRKEVDKYTQRHAGSWITV